VTSPDIRPRAARTLRPVVLPQSLTELQGPATGAVELPNRLCWSLRDRTFDLADPDAVLDMYDAVLDAGTIDDVTKYLNAGLLVTLWDSLGMGKHARDAWQQRFPELRHLPAAAA
jgi:hypothetical protein